MATASITITLDPATHDLIERLITALGEEELVEPTDPAQGLLEGLPIGSIFEDVDGDRWLKSEEGFFMWSLRLAGWMAFPEPVDAVVIYAPLGLVEDTPYFVLDGEGLEALPVGTKLRGAEGNGDDWERTELGVICNPQDEADRATRGRNWGLDGGNCLAVLASCFAPFEVLNPHHALRG